MNVIDRGFYTGCMASAVMVAAVWVIDRTVGSEVMFPNTALVLVEVGLAAVAAGYWVFVQRHL